MATTVSLLAKKGVNSASSSAARGRRSSHDGVVRSIRGLTGCSFLSAEYQQQVGLAPIVQTVGGTNHARLQSTISSATPMVNTVATGCRNEAGQRFGRSSQNDHSSRWSVAYPAALAVTALMTSTSEGREESSIDTPITGRLNVLCKEGKLAHSLPQSAPRFDIYERNIAKIAPSLADLESVHRTPGGPGLLESPSAALVQTDSEAAFPGDSMADVNATDIYRFDSDRQPLGKGNKGTVSIATHCASGQAVAVKRIPFSLASRSEVMEEIELLQIAGAHPNVVTMQAYFEDEEAYYIVMDFCEGGELYQKLAGKGRYSEGQAARIMAEVAEAVRFLHANGIIHFDLKPENIMLAVSEDCIPEVRLTDFGSAFRQHREVTTAKDYTIAYSAPEVLACEDVDEKVDMWALGVIMWVLLTGRHPFDTNLELSEEEVAKNIVSEQPDLRSRSIRHVSPEGKDLLRRLLAKDPEERPSARQMLSHPWFDAVMNRKRVRDVVGGVRARAGDPLHLSRGHRQIAVLNPKSSASGYGVIGG